MDERLSPDLQTICDLELALGNTIVRVLDSGLPGLPLTIIFGEPLHRREVTAKVEVSPSVKWNSLGSFAGYVNEDTRQSVQGPAVIAELARDARDRLSTHLRSIYDLEVSLGNTVARIDEPLDSRCLLAVVFKNPVHRREIESTLALPHTIRWWSNRDPHYPVEGGYMCDETCHAIAGSLSRRP